MTRVKTKLQQPLPQPKPRLLQSVMARTLMAGLLAALISSTAVGTALAPQFASAQGNVTLDINSCDDNAYPDIVCVVTPKDQTGIPVAGLPATAFEVADGSTNLSDVQVEQIENPNVKTNILLVVDFGTSSRNVASLAALRTSAEQILTSLAPDDEIALIGVTGGIALGDVNNPPLDPAKESAFVNAGQQRNSVINIIRTLPAAPGTPLYDALCKGITLASKQTVGSRAVIVLSDGKDVGSKVCKADDPISSASRNGVPVYAIGIGDRLDSAYMQRLALQTGGSFLEAATAGDVAPKFTEIQRGLKTQYRLSFKGVTPPDNDSTGHPLTIRVNTASGRATENTTFKALYPVKPIVQSANFKQGDTAFDLSTPLPYGEVEVTPNLQARNIARVEYLLDGEIVKVVETPPFSFVLNTTTFEPNAERDHVLIIRAYGEMTNPANITEAQYTFRAELPAPTETPPPPGTEVPAQAAPSQATQRPVATVGRGTPQPTAAPAITPTATPSGIGAQLQRNPLLAVLLGVVVIGIIALVIMMLVLQRRRQQASRIAAAANEPQTIMDIPGSPSVDGDGTDGGGEGAGENQTRVFGTVGGLSGVGENRTKVFRPGKATLEFTTGKMKDKKFQVGVGGIDAVLIGREVDVSIGNIKLESEFVSRRHARITLENDKLLLYDLGSASGTRVNGVPLQGRIELNDGDIVEFADTTAQLKMNAPVKTGA